MKKLKETDNTVEATVEMVKEDITILSVPALKNAIVFALTKGLNTKSASFHKFKVGQQVKGHVSLQSLTEVSANDSVAERIFFIPVQNKENVTKKMLDTKRAIKDAIDPEIKNIDDFQMGRLTTGRIQSIKPTQMNITLGANLKGRVHVSEVYDDVPSVFDKPFKGYKTGDKIKVKVIGFHDAKTYKFLPFSHRNPVSQTVVELTARPSELQLDNCTLTSDFDQKRPTLDSIQSGVAYRGFVHSVEGNYVSVHVGPKLLGRVSCFHVSLDPDVASHMAQNFPVGLPVTCWLLSKDLEKHNLDLSLVAEIQAPITRDSLSIGQNLVGKITKVDQGVTLQIANSVFARVHITDLNDAFTKNPLEDYEVGQLVKCCVVQMDSSRNRIDVSLRSSHTDSATEIVDPEYSKIQDISSDAVVQGYIRNVSENGCFVSLGRNLTARVKIAELSDSFIKDWKTAFSAGQLVRGRIMSVDPSSSRIEMSLKQSVVDPDTSGARVVFSDLTEGMKIKGSIKAIETYGVFIQLSNSDISGLCHVSELADVPVKKIDKLYSVGDPVKVVILKIDAEKKRLSLGLKASYFDDMDVEEESDEEPSSESDAMEVDEPQTLRLSQESDEESEASDEEQEESDSEESEEETLAAAAEDSEEDQEMVDPLDLSGFQWTSTTQEEEVAPLSDSEAEGSDQEDASGRKKSKRAKKRAKKDEEERVAKKELSLLEGQDSPEVAEDYERLLMGSPNSSYLWIKFMAFQLQMTEIEKAREVAERALKTINFRDAQEKLNVWVAFLNLENSYGTTESLLKVFERAVNYNEPKTVYIHLARIYERTHKIEQADNLHQVMIKKFKESSKIWTGYGMFLLKNDKIEECRALLPRSLKSLPKRKRNFASFTHSADVKTITAFALMEFKHADPERGRTILEGVLSNYPKRVDLWSVYLDQEIRSGDLDRTRYVFTRNDLCD